MNYPNNGQKEETDRKSGGGGGGEDISMSVGNFEKNPKSYEDPVSGGGGWLGIVFIPRRYQF